MLSSSRRPLAMVIGAVVAASALALPAQGATEPTTLEIEGTLRVVVVDTFGAGAHAEHLYTVVTDDGAEIPVDLDEEAPANGRFRGEVVVDGGVASRLRSKDLLPRAGSTIDEESRAGRVAIAAADDLAKPLAVTSSTVEPAITAAVTTPSAHRAYVAILNNRGSIEESDTAIRARVNAMTDYWVDESDGVITSFAIQGAVARFDSMAAGPVEQSCGMATSPFGVWNEARAKFPAIPFTEESGNHLIVAMANECASAGTAGVALVGSGLSSGGPMSFTLGSIAAQVGVHELGHTFGLGHANLQRCAACGVEPYENLYSPMGLAIGGGNFTSPALDSSYRVRLGVAGPAEVAQVAVWNGPVTRTIRVGPRDGVAGVRGIDVTDPLSGQRFFVDYRVGTGRDMGTVYQSPYGGLVGAGIVYQPGVAVSAPGANGTTNLLPSAPSVAAHNPGQTYVSPTGATLITVNAVAGAAGADVTVTFKLPPKRFSTRTPKITGTARVGKTLKVKVGSWLPRPAYRYQWYANGKKITKKGTKSSFKLTSKQKGKRITVRVTGTKSGYVTTTKPSKATKKVAKRK